MAPPKGFIFIFFLASLFSLSFISASPFGYDMDTNPSTYTYHINSTTIANGTGIFVELDGSSDMTGDLTATPTETHSIGTTLKRWLKGWFVNVDISKNLTVGAPNDGGNIYLWGGTIRNVTSINPLGTNLSLGGTILIAGNAIVSGNLTGTNYYGEFYNKVYGGFETLDLVTTEVYVKITNGSCGLQNGFTCVNSTGNLTTNVGGVYKVSFTISAEAVSTAGEYGTKLFVNNVDKNNCYAFNNFLSGDSSSGGFNCIVRINTGDVLNIGVDDHANPVRDLVIHSMNLNLIRIGN